MVNRPPYNGDHRRLVIALDVGTTYSGISYCVLDPRVSPVITSVKRYPGQGEASGDSKIPSVIVYGPNGDIRAIGAEAEEESFRDQIEEENLIEVRWFKLHLRPGHLHSARSFDEIPPLPLGKSAVRVLADFMAYLFRCAKDYIIDSAGFNGQEIWNSEKDIILTHPNGWEGAQQDQMRRAAIIAGIVPDTSKGRESIHFVTEGEASLHYCVSHEIVPSSLKKDDAVLVVDAGGGTIDISGYSKRSDDKFLFEEAAAPQCYFHGSVFVTRNAKLFLRDFLCDSEYQHSLSQIAECFDKTTKPTFRNLNGPCFIRFGTIRDNDPQFNIRSGKLRLDGAQVAAFFEPSINCITDVIQEAKYKRQIKAAFLVGGFAASDWLFNSLRMRFQGEGVMLCRPDQAPGKAVAEGAISFHLDHYVDTRVARFFFGPEVSARYDPTNSEHIERRSKMYEDLDGIRRIPERFCIILSKDTSVSETQELKYRLSSLRESPMGVVIEGKIYCYRGESSSPQWIIKGPSSEWEVMCTVVADSPSLSSVARKETNYYTGKTYYKVEFEVILLFGLAEFKAQISWKENGIERRSPAVVIYTDDT
ncbi:hypothetical protein AX16_004345 [Volvariella volvacea WC 439]|nr:hypothetical protein AX16_004345 [Volvariella volvacea WC 439]